ncbi:hypothetical protein HYX07_01140 [Candidatus Woesearchaeota archaeon]|nr:hypothetical protein [Candidatus Woesearchaeota archaeon]
MATNISMIGLLERHQKLVDEIAERVAELEAMKKILKYHISEQKRQGGSMYGTTDEYRYDKNKKEYVRVVE